MEEGAKNDLVKAMPTLQKKIAVSASLLADCALKLTLFFLSPQASAPAKKTLNIPIGDVNIDQDYMKDVTPTFQLPSIYVKHIKKIGDEADVSLDYILDLEDEVHIMIVALTFTLCLSFRSPLSRHT